MNRLHSSRPSPLTPTHTHNIYILNFFELLFLVWEYCWLVDFQIELLPNQILQMTLINDLCSCTHTHIHTHTHTHTHTHAHMYPSTKPPPPIKGIYIYSDWPSLGFFNFVFHFSFTVSPLLFLRSATSMFSQVDLSLWSCNSWLTVLLLIFAVRNEASLCLWRIAETEICRILATRL